MTSPTQSMYIRAKTCSWTSGSSSELQTFCQLDHLFMDYLAFPAQQDFGIIHSPASDASLMSAGENHVKDEMILPLAHSNYQPCAAAGAEFLGRSPVVQLFRHENMSDSRLG